MSPTETPVRDPGTATPGRARHAAPLVPGSRGRIVGIDAARGLALLGMMAVHALYVSDATGAPTWVGRIASGNAAALFAVLAGVGVAFMTGRTRVTGAGPARRAGAALVARAAVIGLLGLALGVVTDAEVAAVILPAYAVLFVLAVPLVLLPTPVLVGGAVLGAAGLPALSHLVRAGMPPPTLDNPSLGRLVTDPTGLLRELLLTGTYPALTWIPVPRDRSRARPGPPALATVRRRARGRRRGPRGGRVRRVGVPARARRRPRGPLRDVRGDRPRPDRPAGDPRLRRRRHHPDDDVVVARGGRPAHLDAARPRPHHRHRAGRHRDHALPRRRASGRPCAPP